MNIFFWSIKGVLLFFLVYFEPVFILGLRFSYFWKSVVLCLLMVGIGMRFLRRRQFQQSTDGISCSTLKIGYFGIAWTVIASIFHPEIQSSLILAGQRLLPLLVLHYFLISRVSPQKLCEWIFFSFLFVSASVVPFHFGLLLPLGKGYDVVGLLGASRPGFVGIFQNQHVASLTLAFSSLLACLFSIDGPKTKISSLLPLVSVFLVFTLLLTYARAGFAALGFGIVAYLIVSSRVRTLLRLLVFGGVVSLSVVFLFPETDVLVQRVLGKTLYTESSSVEIVDATSGRTMFWKTALEIYADGGPVVWLTGLGETTLEDRMEQRLSYRIFAHNGFINELLVNGIIGFLIFVYFIYCIYKNVVSVKNNFFRNAGISLFFSWLVFVFFQGGEFPLQTVFVFFFVALGINQQIVSRKMENNQ